jgi:hypothetical protein
MCHRGNARQLRKSFTAAAVALAASSALAPIVSVSAASVASRPADDLPDSIGVNIHIWPQEGPYYQHWPETIQIIRDMGIRQVRDHITEIARFNQLVDQTGVKVDGIVQYTTGPQRNLDDLSRIDTLLNDATRLHGLSWLESPNEWNWSGDPDWDTNLRAWVQQTRIRRDAIPALANIPMIAPSLAGPDFLTVADLNSSIDIGNMHAYTHGHEPTFSLSNFIRDARYLSQDKPIFATEFGLRNSINQSGATYWNHPITERGAAKYIPRTFLEYLNTGIVAKGFVYDLIDDADDPSLTYGEAHYGLLRNDLSYKPAGIAVKNMIALMSDPGPAFTPASLDYALSGGGPLLHSTLFQKRDGRFFLALWQDAISFDDNALVDIDVPTVPVTLTLPAGMLMRRYLLADTSAPVQVSGGSTFVLDVPDEVMFVELSTPQPGWNVNAGGNWSAASNWASANVPSGADATANFLGAILSDQTVTLDAGRTVGMVNFWNNNRYTIAGSDPLTMQTTGNVQASINVPSGSHTIAAPITLASNTTIDVDLAASTLTLTGDMTGTGALSKTGAGVLEVKDIRAGDLTVHQGTVKFTPNSTADGTSRVGAIVIDSGASLDLTDNKLITTSSPGTWTGSAYDGVTGLITSGRLHSTSTAGSYTALGVARASDIGITATTIWAGQTVSPADTLVMYTYGGDATLDGQLNIDDYVKIDSGIAAGLTGWSNGDFNYDGKINIDDYVIIDSNLPAQGARFQMSSIAGMTAAVPEPAAVLPTIALCTTFLRRRGRRRPVLC